MQWSQIKTLFILCFLILNVYLMIQFMDKQKDNDFDVYEQQEDTIEEQLKAENITVPDDLPEDGAEQSYISVKQKVFKEKDIQLLTSLNNQEPEIIGKNMIISTFKDPIKLKDSDMERVKEVIKSNIIHPESYKFWEWNKDLNVLIFFQYRHGQPVFYNQSGLLLVFLNDDNELTFYTQTMLGDEDNDESKKSLIKPLTAIYTIYNRNELFHGEEVTNAKLGYYTALPATGDLQIFAPTWKVTVDHKRDYFVNAIEGIVYSSDKSKFLEDTLSAIVKKMSALHKKDDEAKLKELVSSELNKRLEAINRSEIE